MTLCLNRLQHKGLPAGGQVQHEMRESWVPTELRIYPAGWNVANLMKRPLSCAYDSMTALERTCT